MEVVSQGDGEEVVPQLFWDGEERACVLMRQAFKDVNYCWYLPDVRDLFGIPAAGLMARIRRYAEGRSLVEPEEINAEVYPFYAIKHAYCSDWKEFLARKGRSEELSHLRAYFWDESGDAELLMCITHFIVKKKRKLDPADTAVSRAERSYFLSTGCYYSEDNWGRVKKLRVPSVDSEKFRRALNQEDFLMEISERVQLEMKGIEMSVEQLSEALDRDVGYAEGIIEGYADLTVRELADVFTVFRKIISLNLVSEGGKQNPSSKEKTKYVIYRDNPAFDKVVISAYKNKVASVMEIQIKSNRLYLSEASRFKRDGESLVQNQSADIIGSSGNVGFSIGALGSVSDGY